jgi:nicotinate phosphoribosyltransferase
LTEIRARAAAQLAALDPSVRRLLNPHTSPVGLTSELYEARLQLIERARAARAAEAAAASAGGRP